MQIKNNQYRHSGTGKRREIGKSENVENKRSLSHIIPHTYPFSVSIFPLFVCVAGVVGPWHSMYNMLANRIHRLLYSTLYIRSCWGRNKWMGEYWMKLYRRKMYIACMYILILRISTEMKMKWGWWKKAGSEWYYGIYICTW